VEQVDRTIAAAIAGDEAAWHSFLQHVVPRIEAIARTHSGLRSRGLAQKPDDLADIVAACLERFARNDKQNLARYLEQRAAVASVRAPTFDSWLYGAVDFSVRDHLRRRFGRAPNESLRSSGRALPNKRDLGSGAAPIEGDRLRDSVARLFGVTTRLTLAQIVTYLATNLTSIEAQALQLHFVREKSFAEIAAELEIENSVEAERMIRRVIARMRHRFGPDRFSPG
jgi:DNA-directed RNA polymerase specialized sigma24 family protein